MKQITRYSIAIATLLLMSMGAWAAGGFTVNYQLDGESTTATVGEVTYSNGTITVTPADGYYLTAEDLKVIKTIDGQYGQTRTDPSIDATVAITATDANADPSGVTTYTFTVTDEKYDYEITANFHSRKDVAEALIALPEDAVFVYSGEAIEPAVSVTYAGEAMTADKDYTIEYANNINVGSGDITITGIGIYKGTKTVNFDINQASVAIRFESADGSEAKELSSVYGTAFTEPILKLDPAGVIEVNYSVDNEEIATVDAATGKLTILKTGTVVVTAAAKEDYTNKEGSNYNANPTNTKASYSLTITTATPTLKFSAETATATMGTTFVAPTLTVTPEGLVPIEYESTNTEVATVDKNTGVVTLVGKGEATIKAVFPGNENYETALASYILTVSKATATLKFSAETATAIMGAEFEAPKLTVTPEGLQDVKYSSSNANVATVNETTGAVTLVGAGEAVIKASFAGTTVYEAAEASYKLTVSKVTTTLKFSAETATATMGAEFEAPTLTVTPEGLQGVKYTSSNTDVATVNETTGAVTLVAAGETTIKASFAGNDNYEAAEASYKLTVSEATPQTETVTLTFSEKTVSATLGEEFEAPTLTIEPEGLQGVKYTSSNTDVATVNETTGAVTLVAAGETTIKASFAGNDNYEAATASYTLTVNRAQGQGYGLWINNIQVTEDNQKDVLVNSTDSKSGTIVFNPEKNTLVMTNDVSNVEIESRLETLTLHINDVNKVKSIRFNNLGDATKTGKLAITTNGNFPGQIIITNTKGVSAISGFADITLELGLQFLDPETAKLESGTLYKYDWQKDAEGNYEKDADGKFVIDPATGTVCNALTVGVVITPLTRNETVQLTNASDFVAKDENGNTVLDENGNPKTVSMMNFAQNKDILLTLWTKNDEDNYQKGNDGDWPDAGFDDSDGDPGIAMVNTMTDAQAEAVATAVTKNEYLPGGSAYAENFNGATFIVPAGSGMIEVDVKVDEGYEYHLKPIGSATENHISLNHIRGHASILGYWPHGDGKYMFTIRYSSLREPTYYMIYLVKPSASMRGGTRLGKRDKAHGKLYSVGVRPRSITEVNPPSEASGGVIDEEEDPDGVIDTPTPPSPPTGIQTVASESSANSGKWFTADGRQLEGKPTKPGFYIRNGKKIVIK